MGISLEEFAGLLNAFCRSHFASATSNYWEGGADALVHIIKSDPELARIAVRMPLTPDRCGQVLAALCVRGYPTTYRMVHGARRWRFDHSQPEA